MTAFGGAIGDPTKIMGSRIGAYIVDSILISVLLLGAFMLIEVPNLPQVDRGTSAAAFDYCQNINAETQARNQAGYQPSDQDRVCVPRGLTAYVLDNDDLGSLYLRVWLYSTGLSILNWVILSAIAGGTVGKLLFGLRVVSANGYRAGIGRTIVRWILLPIDAACCALPGLLTSFNSKGHKRIGDMAAGTYVVHRSAENRLLSIPGHQVVRGHNEFGGWGPAPVAPELGLNEGGGVDKPVWDDARNTYVRYDPASGVWFQWDDATESWVPAQT